MKAVILVGGPSSDSSFRPLSLDCPKPLFLVGGRQLIYHQIAACAALPDCIEVILLGFYPDGVFRDFCNATARELKMRIRYLKEKDRCGTAGGLLSYKDEIFHDDPKNVLVFHCDIACKFPLQQMVDAHIAHGQLATVLVTSVPSAYSTYYGCVVIGEDNNIEHYAEKPDTHVCDTINAGVYCFSKDFWAEMSKLRSSKEAAVATGRSALFRSPLTSKGDSFCRLEQDVLFPLSGTGVLKGFIFDGPWQQIKRAEALLYSNALYLDAELENTEIPRGLKCEIKGKNLIHPTAQVHPSALIGPYVTLEANAKVGKGARISYSLINDGASVGEHAFVSNTIMGVNSTAGAWSRLEGIRNQTPIEYQGERRVGATILGQDASVKPEVHLFNSIVMPHKVITKSQKHKVIM